MLSCIIAAVAACGASQSDDVHVRGKMIITNHGKLSDDAMARVSLIEQAGPNADQTIVAERSLHNLGQSPVSFDLAIGRERLHSGGQYGLSAQILDPSGNVRWQTPVPQAISPIDQPGPATLILQASAAYSAGDPKHYRCADAFYFDMTRNNKQAVLRMGHRQITLSAAQSDDVTTPVYANGHGDQLTFGHHKITLTIDGETHINCRPVSNGKNKEKRAPKAAKSDPDPGPN